MGSPGWSWPQPPHKQRSRSRSPAQPQKKMAFLAAKQAQSRFYTTGRSKFVQGYDPGSSAAACECYSIRVHLLAPFLGGFEVLVLVPGRVDGPYAREISARVDILQSTTKRTLFSTGASLGKKQLAGKGIRAHVISADACEFYRG